MIIEQIKAVSLIAIFTIISGLADSQGFLHSSNVWKNGKFITSESIKSLIGFGIGSVVFWFAIKHMQQVGIVTAEIQTIFWFTITILGVALASGKFFHWNIIDQAVGTGIFIGLIFLIFRTKS